MSVAAGEAVVEDAVRTRNWCAIVAVPVGLSTAARAMGLFSTGYFTVWMSSVLLLCLVGESVRQTAVVTRLRRDALGDGDLAVGDEASSAGWLRQHVACLLWFGLAIAVWLGSDGFRSAFADFGLSLNVVTEFVVHPYAGHLFLAVGFVFLTWIALCETRQDRGRVARWAFGGVAIAGAVVGYGYFQPLVKLLTALG